MTTQTQQTDRQVTVDRSSTQYTAIVFAATPNHPAEQIIRVYDRNPGLLDWGYEGPITAGELSAIQYRARALLRD